MNSAIAKKIIKKTIFCTCTLYDINQSIKLSLKKKYESFAFASLPGGYLLLQHPGVVITMLSFTAIQGGNQYVDLMGRPITTCASSIRPSVNWRKEEIYNSASKGPVP